MFMRPHSASSGVPPEQSAVCGTIRQVFGGEDIARSLFETFVANR
jgi:hypothetical protein